MQLLALIFASTSMLSAFPEGPAVETLHVDVGGGTPVAIEVALGRAEGDVPVPIRITAGDVDIELGICDGTACSGARTIRVPAGGVVEEVAIVDNGRPNLRVKALAPVPREEVCCYRSNAVGRTVALIGDAPAVDVEETYNSNPTVYVVGVGRLLDDEPAQFGNVGAVVMRAGDLDHDAAFFANLRRFAALGGLVSVDPAQGARLTLGKPTDLDTLHAQNLAVHTGIAAGVFDIAVGENRRVGTFPLAIDAIPALRGTVFVLDNGLVIVRDADVGFVDATADLVVARSLFVYATRPDWRGNGNLTNALLVGLQPHPSPLPMATWLALTSIAAAVIARVVIRRRPGMAGPVLASLAVVVTLVVGSVATVAVSFAPSSWRTASVRVLGPGKTIRTRTLATARSPDFNVEATALHTGINAQGRSFVADTRRARRAQVGPGVAEVRLHVDLDEGPGHLLQQGPRYTNNFAHPVTVHPRSTSAAMNVAPGKSVEPDLPFQGDDDTTPLHVLRVIDAMQQRCQCAVASFVDTDGVFTVAEGTFE